MALSEDRRQELFKELLEVASSFDIKALREHGTIDWLEDDWDQVEDDYYEMCEQVRQLVLDIEPPKPTLYNQINNKARQYMMDIKNPVILYAHGRYNRGCNEISGEDVCEDYGSEEGDYSIPGSDKGAIEWFGDYDYNKHEYIGDPPGQKVDITECLKKKSDEIKLLEEVGESIGEWDSIILIYWNPESKSIEFQLTNPAKCC